MSTRYDILAAKQDYENHLTAHHCRTGEGCPARLIAWNAYQRTAGLWGAEPGDNERQRAQYHKSQQQLALRLCH